MRKPVKNILNEKDVPSLNDGVDVISLNLTPKEGFVLSRVDGNTSIAEISSISGIEVEEIINIFAKLLVNKIVRFKASDIKKEAVVKSGKRMTIIEELDSDEKDEVLSKIPREKRKMILLMERDIETQNYYEIFGLERNALEGKIKKAYLKLTKDFHPDRFFGKSLGKYKKKLELIFQKTTEIFETLGDNDKRLRYDKETFADKIEEVKEEAATENRFRSKTLIEKLAEAKKYFALGEKEFSKHNVVSASSYFKLALSMDPKNSTYEAALERTKPALDKKRARLKYEEGINKAEYGDVETALAFLTEAHELDPSVPEYSYNLAKLLFAYKKDYIRSKELCIKALEHMGDDPEARITMGQIYKAAGLTKNAMREFKLALKLDKGNKTAKMELEEIS